jgi:hypothetical protein
MELTRRDALLALAGSGVAIGGKSAVDGLTSSTEDSTISPTDVATLVATAEVLYPSQIDPSEEFVTTYVSARFERGDDQEQVAEALAHLRKASRRETGRAFHSLSRADRDTVLRGTGADRAHPDPSGTRSQQLRYFVINELLYALYSTPKGAGLVGNTNPDGYPGGIEAYQQEVERD